MNGNATLRLLPFLLASLFLFGCGTPNTPVGPQPPSDYFDVLNVLETRGNALDLDLEGDSLYVAENSAGVGFYDVSDPAAITLTHHLPTSEAIELVDAVPEMNALFVHNGSINHIYLLDSLDNGQITSLGSSGVNTILTHITTDSVKSLNFEDAETVETDVIRTLICDKNSGDGLQVYTVWLDSTDDVVFPLDTLSIFSRVEKMNLDWSGIEEAGAETIAGFDTVAISLHDYGVAFADISKEVEDQDGVWLSDINTPGDAQGLAYSDGYLYVADGYAGLSVIDAQDVTAPVFVANRRIKNLDHAIKVFVKDDQLVLMDQFDGFFFYDISTPEAPDYQGSYEIREPTSAVFVDDDMMILASVSEGLTTIKFK
ncbi:MAG TPA: hypothetical protein ENH10_08735 [Bacteroidetes bacterium]|nr:hypothetical protein [Bacteroidota bacterium]HEX05221.1 hypothetical protein [Bacteroidota bacterium]